jgi:hypothetical protein
MDCFPSTCSVASLNHWGMGKVDVEVRAGEIGPNWKENEFEVIKVDLPSVPAPGDSLLMEKKEFP